MSLFGQAKRHVPVKPRRSPLPFVAGETEKFGLASHSGSSTSSLAKWVTIIYVPIPRLPFGGRSTPTLANGSSQKTFYAHNSRGHGRTIGLPLPIPPRVFARIQRLNPVIRVAMVLVLLVSGLFILLGFRRNSNGHNTWSPPFKDPNTLVLTPQEVAKVWEWEVLSGHHPSLEDGKLSPICVRCADSTVPESVPIERTLVNPVVASSLLVAQPTSAATGTQAGTHQRVPAANSHSLTGAGPARRYIAPWETPLQDPGYPARPAPGTILDLDIVVDKCDFGGSNYVRDCLELLRVGANLDNGKRVRHKDYLKGFKQSYLEQPFTPIDQSREWTPLPRELDLRPSGLSRAPLSLAPPRSVAPAFSTRNNPCDPDYPRIFHMFWAGAFTDKPYMAVMSFLYTQNLGLDRPLESSQDKVRGSCRPQFWVWINPGPAAAIPNPDMKRQMFETLATNPWSAPFLHQRFRDVVKFKMWNTTEQLDGVDELKPYWRDMPIFNSGGNVYKMQKKPEPERSSSAAEEKMGDVVAEAAEEAIEEEIDSPPTKKKNTIFEKVGSNSESDYDRLSVILSDMARFVLTHRYGGIYLDADTLFLRDWEELWNYRGQFAYRWSWHQKYNTAVLKLHKKSALSTFLFKTALENGMDFHPMTVSRYLKDAGLDKLLIRIPDALFDPAWLNMERYQRERPPFPYFPEFSVFFSNDKFDTGGPEQLGFDAFFRGSFSYHFHNSWWLPFDPSRNWPDLGERFAKGETVLREAQSSAAALSRAEHARTSTDEDEESAVSGTVPLDDEADQTDLSWATVLKRTFESFLRAEQPNMYGEWIKW